MLFLQSSPAARPDHNFELISDRTLNTYGLGQYVAPKWQLGRVLRWQPAVKPAIRNRSDVPNNGDDRDLALALRSHPALVKSVGLYKVMGEGVQALIGGVYHQFVSRVRIIGDQPNLTPNYNTRARP